MSETSALVTRATPSVASSRVRFAILDRAFILGEHSSACRQDIAALLAPSLRWMLYQALAELSVSDHAYASVQVLDKSRLPGAPAGRSSSAGWRLSSTSPVTASRGAVASPHHGSADLSTRSDEDDCEYLDRGRAAERFNAAGSDLARAWVVVEYRRELLSLRVGSESRHAERVTPVSSLQRLLERQAGGRTALAALVSTVGKGREADPELKQLACRRYEYGDDSFRTIADALSIDGLKVSERTLRRWWIDHLRATNEEMSAL